MIKPIALALVTLGLLSACASTPNNTLAMQKANNTFEVTGIGKTNLLAKNNAISAANDTCGKKQNAIILEEKTEYQGALKGVVSDQTGKIIGAAADILGGITGTSTGINRDSDYQSTLIFQCQTK